MPKHQRTVSKPPVDFLLIQSTSITPPASHGTAEEPQTSNQEDHSSKRARTDTLDEVQMGQLTVQQTLPQPLSEEEVFNDVSEPSSSSRSQSSLPTTEHYSSGGSVNSEDEEDENSNSEAGSQFSFGSPESSSAPPSLDEGEENQPSEDRQDYYNPSSDFSSEPSSPPVNEEECSNAENTGVAAPSATSAPASSNQFFDDQPGETGDGLEIHLYHNSNQPRPGTPRPIIETQQWPNSNTHSPEQEHNVTPPASPDTFRRIDDLLTQDLAWQEQNPAWLEQFVSTLGEIATGASHPEADGGLPSNE